MKFIAGEDIGKSWTNRSAKENDNLLQQCKDIFEELRNIPHPRPGTVAAADMQALYDPRTWKGRLGFGPFANEKDFNNFLRVGMQADSPFILRPCLTNQEVADFRKLIALQDSKTGERRICFTHGDASSSNILVKDGKVVSLIDFELSGFYPEYWEYATAMNVHKDDEFWKAEIPKFLNPYPEEYEMELLRKKHFSSLGLRRQIPWS